VLWRAGLLVKMCHDVAAAPSVLAEAGPEVLSAKLLERYLGLLYSKPIVPGIGHVYVCVIEPLLQSYQLAAPAKDGIAKVGSHARLIPVSIEPHAGLQLPAQPKCAAATATHRLQAHLHFIVPLPTHDIHVAPAALWQQLAGCSSRRPR
jgi:hypothetical protein